MSSFLIETALGRIYKFIKPFLTKKRIEQLLKNIRLNSPKTITFLIMPRCKTFIYEYLKSSKINSNLLLIDFDSKTDNILLNNDFEYNKILNSITNNTDLLLPSQFKCIQRLKNDFYEKSIVIISSNINLSEYTRLRIPSEINIFIPSPMYLTQLTNTLSEQEAKDKLFNDYQNIILSKKSYEIYTSLEDIREKVKALFM
jgi:hypothetical protein